MIAIGSKAMLRELPKTLGNEARRISSDYDVIMTMEQFDIWVRTKTGHITKMYPTEGNKYKVIVNHNYRTKQYEIEIAFPGTSAEFLIQNIKSVTNDNKEDMVEGVFGEKYAPLNLTYLMLTKRSHLMYPVHFEKNMVDYHEIKAILGEVKKDKKMQVYYNLRKEEAKKRYKQRTPKLNVSNEDFFSSKLIVEQFFVHDDIHEVMKHHEKPVYEMMKRDFDSAWCEKDMFFELPYEMQVQAVQEEAYTIALERYVIPKYRGIESNDHFSCYKKALKRICTTLCSGWFRDFAIENYQAVLDNYDKDYVKKFERAHKNGEIKTIEGKHWKLS